MKLSLNDSTILKDSITVISDLVNEARFKIKKDYIELIAMDPANVAMVIFKMLSSAFTDYHIDQEKEIAINLSNLKQILRRAKANDILTLEMPEENKLQITLKSSSIRTFQLPLLDFEEREQKIPNLSFPCKVIMPSNLLSEAIEDSSVAAESVTFGIEGNKLTIDAEGDLTKANIQLEQNQDIKISTETKAKIKSKFSIEYLKKMMAGSKLSDNVEINLNQDYPLKLDYKVMDKLILSFVLAPRMEND